MGGDSFSWVRGRIGAACIGGLGRKGERSEQAIKDFRGFLKRRHKGSGNRAIAIKAVEVCSSLLLEFLPMFDFSSCSFMNILILLIGVDGKGHKIIVLRSVPDIYYTLIRILFSLILLLIPKHHLYQYECHDH